MTGLYRVNYDHENWELLSSHLNSDKFEEIPAINRALLLDDALNLARSGKLPYRVALNVTNYLYRETHHLPWKSALRNLEYILHMLHLTDALPSYKVTIIIRNLEYSKILLFYYFLFPPQWLDDTFFVSTCNLIWESLDDMLGHLQK